MRVQGDRPDRRGEDAGPGEREPWGVGVEPIPGRSGRAGRRGEEDQEAVRAEYFSVHVMFFFLFSPVGAVVVATVMSVTFLFVAVCFFSLFWPWNGLDWGGVLLCRSVFHHQCFFCVWRW